MYKYLYQRMKADKLGFKETMWLDSPCKGWRVLKKRMVQRNTISIEILKLGEWSERV